MRHWNLKGVCGLFILFFVAQASLAFTWPWEQQETKGKKQESTWTWFGQPTKAKEKSGTAKKGQVAHVARKERTGSKKSSGHSVSGVPFVNLPNIPKVPKFPKVTNFNPVPKIPDYRVNTFETGGTWSTGTAKLPNASSIPVHKQIHAIISLNEDLKSRYRNQAAQLHSISEQAKMHERILKKLEEARKRSGISRVPDTSEVIRQEKIRLIREQTQRNYQYVTNLQQEGEAEEQEDSE